MWIAWILTGIIVGVVVTNLFFMWLYLRVKPSLDSTRKAVTGNIEKLILAKKRLGQIANRESIGEARKIANTALKELK